MAETVLHEWLVQDGSLAMSVTDTWSRCGCGDHDTRTRIGGKPWVWICYQRSGALDSTKLDLYAALKQFPPKARGDNGGMVNPRWCPRVGEWDVTGLVHRGAFIWKRPYDGPTLLLDRSGAHMSSAATVEIAHGPLERQEERIPWTGLTGFYKVAYCDWKEEGTPHPLGGAAGYARRQGEVWVPHTRVKLLADLAEQGRWSDLGLMEAFVSQTKCRLDKWAKHVNDLRCAALDQHGRDSAEYVEVKRAFSRAMARLTGNEDPGQRRRWDGDIHRTDWAYSVQDLSGCTMWRWCDDLGQLARHHGHPEWAPVALQHEDEMIIPAEALDFFTTTERLRGRRPLRLDPTGKTLGTFKVKEAA